MTGDDTVRLTYAELAKARGVSLGAARRMVQRHKWPRQIGNDGFTRIAVPAAFISRPESVDIDVAPDVLVDVVEGVDMDASRDVDIDTSGLQVLDLDKALVAFAKVSRDVMVD